MNCEEISELLPAYVLGALDREEIEAVEAHLQAGHEHDAELVELRATVFAMDRYQDELMPAPSPSLAARVRGIAEPQQAQAGARIAARTPSFLASGLMRSVAAALAFLLVFGAGWLAGGALTGDGNEVLAYVVQGEDGVYMEVRGSTAGDSVSVTMAGLERLAGSSYQVWAIREGTWLSIGVCNTDSDGWWVGDFDFRMEGGEEVALTIEPAGGSERPTSEPLLRTR